MSPREEQIKKECWDKSLHALGTSYVFQLKTKTYRTWIRVITILGLVVPLLLGAFVAAYGQNSNIVTAVIIIITPIGILQVVLSGISLVSKWDDQLAYALESQTDNRVISGEYEDLAKRTPSKIEEYEKEFAIIKTKDDARIRQDEKISFSSKENRKGMRYALWIRRKECATCGTIPVSMTSTDCETCGKF